MTSNPTAGRVLSTQGELSWAQLAKLLGSASLFVGVDTAAMHLAAAVQCPSVVLFGHAPAYQFRPWKSPHRVVRAKDEMPELLKKALEVNGAKIVSSIYADVEKDQIRELRDMIASTGPKHAMVFGTSAGGRPTILISFTDDLVAAGLDASLIVKEAGKVMSGGGGGKKHLAEAGGSDPSKLGDAVAKAIELIKAALGALPS